MSAARYAGAMAGASNTASLFFGGTPGGVTLTESWNGSAWTEVNDLNPGRTSLGGSGTYTSAIASAGGSSPRQFTEIWNGTIWRKDGDLSAGRDLVGSSGSDNTEGLTFGGRNPPTVYANTEEFSAGAVSTKTISTD